MTKWIHLLSTVLFSHFATGQQLETINLSEFYQQVRQHHPMAKRAQLIIQRGDMVVSESRGAFDPKLVSEYETKQFQGKDYYDIWDSYVKIPTRLNVDLKAGYERNTGSFLNPENTVPSGGLYYAGISVPIGQGLIHNSRNIGIKKGVVEQKTLQNEAYAVYNNLMLDANQIYWYWFESYQKMRVAETNLELMSERFLGIRAGALNGENASIDSVEALIQVQTWMNNLEKAKIEYQNMGIEMTNFIWEKEIDANRTQPDTIWDTIEPILVDDYVEFAFRHHPDLNAMKAKLNGLELDRKLAAENIKPVLNLNYNFITSSGQAGESMAGLTNNYKGGFEFSFPMFIRKERAKLKQAKIKIQEGDLKLGQKSREVSNKIFQSYGKLIVLSNMLNQQKKIVENYEVMLLGEKSKFENGESSIFLINSRENKKVAAEMKLVELEAEYGRTYGLTQWASAIFIKDLATHLQ